MILCDWGDGATTWYFQASSNARIVGAEIAVFVRFLHDKVGISMSNVHIVGHSLGAHIAGYAGASLKGKLGRITALDPAKPYFEATHSSVRLDRSDALYVDVVHTDASVDQNNILSM